MDYENIIFEKEENIAIITFNRPEAMNALNNQTRAEFRAAIDDVAEDDAIKELIYTGDIIRAEEADRLGLVNRVVPMDELMPAAKELARKIAAKSAAALKLAKTAINHGMQTNLESGLKYEYELYSLSLSLEDKLEGVNAFLEKRAPKFVGR